MLLANNCNEILVIVTLQHWSRTAWVWGLLHPSRSSEHADRDGCANALELRPHGETQNMNWPPQQQKGKFNNEDAVHARVITEAGLCRFFLNLMLHAQTYVRDNRVTDCYRSPLEQSQTFLVFKDETIINFTNDVCATWPLCVFSNCFLQQTGRVAFLCSPVTPQHYVTRCRAPDHQRHGPVWALLKGIFKSRLHIKYLSSKVPSWSIFNFLEIGNERKHQRKIILRFFCR